MRWNRRLITLVMILVLILTACNSGASSSQEKNKTMYIGIVNSPILFNPINSADIASQYVEGYMFDSLLDMPSPLEFTPKLADTFETMDNQTYIIKLNDKAKWSDGEPVTAEDAAFTLNLIANPKVETHIGTYLSSLEGLENGKLPEGETEIPSVKVIDHKTLQLKTKQPIDPNLIKEQLGVKLMILPKHVLENVDPSKLSQHPFMQKPNVTSGPFKFVQYKKDQYVEFEQNPDYYLGKPKLDRMFIKIMVGANVVSQLQTGEIDMNAALGKIPVQDYQTVEGFDHITTDIQPTIGFQMMVFNTDSIKEAKVRQAIAYAINRQSIVDDLLKGTGEIIDGPYTSLSPYLNKELKQYTYDPEKAKQLLNNSGWDVAKPIKLVVPTGNKVREQSADILTQNLKDIGLKVEVTTYDFPTSLQKARQGDFDLYLLGNAISIDPDVSAIYASTATWNLMKYNNPKVDELLEKGKSEADPEKRKAIYNELQEIWNKDLPVFTLYSDYNFTAISKDVTYGGVNLLDASIDYHKWDIGGDQ